ncbi:MAG: hypothetical protein Q8Q01_05145 [archaeon]|nr:hypothetical protein [archaeon]
MEEVGKVTYSRFEKDPNSEEYAEVTDLILSLHRDPKTRHGLVYIPRYDVGPSDKICLAIEPTISFLSKLYRPFFEEYVHKDKTLVERTIEESLKNINFQDGKLFDEKSKDINTKLGLTIVGKHEYGNGSYIKINDKSPWRELYRVVIHETGHALHYITFPYVHEDKNIMDYDSTMQEVMAISLAERTFRFVNYSKDPHKKAKELINRLKTSERFNKTQFHQRWWQFLHYFNHEQFEEEYVEKWEDEEEIMLPSS